MALSVTSTPLAALEALLRAWLADTDTPERLREACNQILHSWSVYLAEQLVANVARDNYRGPLQQSQAAEVYLREHGTVAYLPNTSRDPGWPAYLAETRSRAREVR